MDVRNVRWWFENRLTGEITIAQFPNWPIWCIAACWLAQLTVAEGSGFDDVLGWATRILWVVWAADEIVRGVNPWRRLLGTIVVGWQVVSILTVLS